MSIVPFSKDVNVGSANASADWIDWTDWDASNGSNVKTCTGSGYQQTCTTNWVPKAHSTWNGCVTDRGGSNASELGELRPERDRAKHRQVTDSLFPADQYSSCTLAMTGLSYNWASMTSLVNQMTPNGSTNQPIGLVWGWQSLAGGGPFTVPAEDPNYTYQKAIILLSDGLNTQDRWYGNGSNTSTQVDSRMFEAKR